MDYSKTLRLPQTEFPMRGNLPVCHVPRHVLVADNNILQCLIQGMADVDLARRA